MGFVVVTISYANGLCFHRIANYRLCVDWSTVISSNLNTSSTRAAKRYVVRPLAARVALSMRPREPSLQRRHAHKCLFPFSFLFPIVCVIVVVVVWVWSVHVCVFCVTIKRIDLHAERRFSFRARRFCRRFADAGSLCICFSFGGSRFWSSDYCTARNHAFDCSRPIQQNPT